MLGVVDLVSKCYLIAVYWMENIFTVVHFVCGWFIAIYSDLFYIVYIGNVHIATDRSLV